MGKAQEQQFQRQRAGDPSEHSDGGSTREFLDQVVGGSFGFDFLRSKLAHLQGFSFFPADG